MKRKLSHNLLRGMRYLCNTFLASPRRAPDQLGAGPLRGQHGGDVVVAVHPPPWNTIIRRSRLRCSVQRTT